MAKDSDLNDLQQKIAAFCKARDWKQFHNPKDVAISLLLEASEVLEHFQWKNTEEMEKHVNQHKQEVSHELADVLYWVLLMAHDLDIDLIAAMEEKMAHNEAKYPVEKARGSHKKYTEL